MASAHTNPEPGRDLPPVQPPSGRFIAQLFLVPGLIVFCVVLLVLAVNYLFVSGHSADQFLARLDSDNADIRWRGANDLAQVLKRKESIQLKTDVPFALGLVDRLEKALDELNRDETAVAADYAKGDKVAAERGARKLEPQRNLVNFLAASIGDFSFPVGVPALCELIAKEPTDKNGPGSIPQTMRRRHAVWSLANLGNNLKMFQEQLKVEQRQLIVSALKAELEGPAGRRRAAKTALFYLGALDGPDDDVVHADDALAKAASSDDRFLREQVALALNFWEGPQTEPTLVKLADDHGEGTLLRTPDEP